MRILREPVLTLNGAPDSLRHVADNSLTRCSASSSRSVSTRRHSSFTPTGLEASSPTASSRSPTLAGSALPYLNEFRGGRQSGFNQGSN